MSEPPAQISRCIERLGHYRIAARAVRHERRWQIELTDERLVPSAVSPALRERALYTLEQLVGFGLDLDSTCAPDRRERSPQT